MLTPIGFVDNEQGGRRFLRDEIRKTVFLKGLTPRRGVANDRQECASRPFVEKAHAAAWRRRAREWGLADAAINQRCAEHQTRQHGCAAAARGSGELFGRVLLKPRLEGFDELFRFFQAQASRLAIEFDRLDLSAGEDRVGDFGLLLRQDLGHGGELWAMGGGL